MPASDLGRTTPLSPPIVPSSVFTLADLDALEAVISGDEPGFIYARDAHPNGRLLADALATLEGGTWGAIGASGMAAVTASLLAVAGPGDRVVASDRLYGRTRQLLARELSRFGVVTEFIDITDPAAVASATSRPAAAVYAETLSNPLVRVGNVPALAKAARACGARLIIDNTFATPVLLRPLEHGADLVVESLTKLIGGHSDLTLGAVCGRDDGLRERIGEILTVWGLASVSAFDCWLALRGTKTLALRVRAATANAAAVADWLANRPGVSRIAYPDRPDHPDCEVATRLMPAGRGNMLCFELAGGREAVNVFMRRTPDIPFSPSLGSVNTTCSHPASTSHRHDPPAERQRQGITDGLIRLSVGVEDLDLILAALGRGIG
jgi:cystathionine gamma-synthase